MSDRLTGVTLAVLMMKDKLSMADKLTFDVVPKDFSGGLSNL